jgi:hypothetical protein
MSKPNDHEKKQTAEGPEQAVRATAAKLSTGEYLAAILLAITPTSLGLALSDVVNALATPALGDWQTAMRKRALKDPNAKAALDPFFDNTTNYPGVLTALLGADTLMDLDGKTPLKYSDGSHVTINYASRLKDLIWNYNTGNQGAFTTPWTMPPHPPGAKLATLITDVKLFSE